MYWTNLLTEKPLFQVEVIPFAACECEVRHWPSFQENCTTEIGVFTGMMCWDIESFPKGRSCKALCARITEIAAERLIRWSRCLRRSSLVELTRPVAVLSLHTVFPKPRQEQGFQSFLQVLQECAYWSLLWLRVQHLLNSNCKIPSYLPTITSTEVEWELNSSSYWRGRRLSCIEKPKLPCKMQLKLNSCIRWLKILQSFSCKKSALGVSNSP